MGNVWSKLSYLSRPDRIPFDSSSVDQKSSSVDLALTAESKSKQKTNEQDENQQKNFIDCDVTINEHHHHSSSSKMLDSNAEKIKTEIQQNFKKKLEDFQDQSIATNVIDVNKNLNSVQLQISKEITLPQYDGPSYQVDSYYSSSNRIRVKNYSEIMTHKKGNVNMKEIFKCCKEKAKKEFETMYNKPKITEEEYMELNGNCIAVTGEAGIGKTTFTKMLVHNMQGDSDILPGVEFIFYIQFRYVDYDKKTNLIEFLVTSCRCNWEWGKLDSNTLKTLLDSIVASKCCFIFDGLDEAKIDLSSKFPFCSLYSENSAEYFIKNILSGKIFPKATKLFTSRTLQLFELHPDCRPPFILQILGFDKDAQVDMCKQICGEEKYVKALAHLEQEISLLNLCYVPVNCILIMHTVNQRMQENTDEQINLTTMTDVMVSSLKHYLQSEHMRDKKELGMLIKLAHLAFNGTKTAKSIFTTKNLTDVGITDSMLDSFLGSGVFAGTNLKVKILECSKCSFFSHLTWQEFFCAIHVFYFLPVEKYKFFVSRLEESRFDKVGKFMWGFCNMDTQNQLDLMFGKVENVGVKHDLLLDSVTERIKISVKNSMKGSHYEQYGTDILYCFSLLKEASLKSLTKKIVADLPEKLIFNQIILLPSDVLPLAYVLQNATKAFEIFFHFQFIHGSLDRFMKEVLKMIGQNENSFIKIPNLNVSDNELTLEHIQIICTCLSKISELNLRGCRVDYDRCELLWSARERNKEVIVKGVAGLAERHKDFPAPEPINTGPELSEDVLSYYDDYDDFDEY